MSARLSQEEFIKKAKLKHGDAYDYSEAIYTGNRNKIKIYCNRCNQYFYQRAENHLNGAGCPNCLTISKTRKLEDFIKKARDVHGDAYDYSDIVYINNRVKVKIYCKHCKKYFWQNPKHHCQGRGCPACGIIKNSKAKVLTTEIFIEKAIAKHGTLYDYSEIVYKKMHEPVKIYCKNCKKFFYQIAYTHLNGNGCPNCRRSHGEAAIQIQLDKFCIKYHREHYFKGCVDKGKLLFDFYLPDYNMCIEYQGKQHYDTNFLMALFKVPKKEAELQLEKQKYHDQIKRDYCASHGIKLLEIKYTENVEKALKSALHL